MVRGVISAAPALVLLCLSIAHGLPTQAPPTGLDTPPPQPGFNPNAPFTGDQQMPSFPGASTSELPDDTPAESSPFVSPYVSEHMDSPPAGLPPFPGLPTPGNETQNVNGTSTVNNATSPTNATNTTANAGNTTSGDTASSSNTTTNATSGDKLGDKTPPGAVVGKPGAGALSPGGAYTSAGATDPKDLLSVEGNQTSAPNGTAQNQTNTTGDNATATTNATASESSTGSGTGSESSTQSGSGVGSAGDATAVGSPSEDASSSSSGTAEDAASSGAGSDSGSGTAKRNENDESASATGGSPTAVNQTADGNTTNAGNETATVNQTTPVNDTTVAANQTTPAAANRTANQTAGTTETTKGPLGIAGEYSDPKHIGSTRTITVQGPDKAGSDLTITGKDSPLSVEWTASGKLVGPNPSLVVDFSSHGGPVQLVGKHDPSTGNIYWKDNNVWIRFNADDDDLKANNVTNTTSTNATTTTAGKPPTGAKPPAPAPGQAGKPADKPPGKDTPKPPGKDAPKPPAPAPGKDAKPPTAGKDGKQPTPPGKDTSKPPTGPGKDVKPPTAGKDTPAKPAPAKPAPGKPTTPGKETTKPPTTPGQKTPAKPPAPPATPGKPKPGQGKKWILPGGDGDDLSGGSGPPLSQQGKDKPSTKFNPQCQQGSPCEVAHGTGHIHCGPSGGACRASVCDPGYEVDTENYLCREEKDDCRLWSAEASKKPCTVAGTTNGGNLVCDKKTGHSHCQPHQPIIDVDGPTTTESSGYWGIFGMMLIAGVVAGMFYMKSHLPPQVQAYLGGPATKSHGGSEYEMVPMQSRDEHLSAVDSPISTATPSGESTFAQEAEGDWGDDDGGWGGGDDEWGDSSWGDDGPPGQGKVRALSAAEAEQNSRFNNNRG